MWDQDSRQSRREDPSAYAANCEPIAIIGMACKFPGAPNLSAFWDLLEAGGNAISESDPGSGLGRAGSLFPNEAHRGAACRFGAFVDDIEQFDAPFFRISPVEAQMLDPQQRMMLETSWQALEDAGIPPDRLKGSRTGVYAGISTDEYRMLVLDSARPTEAAGCLYALSGTNMNGAAGRVAFVLGLMGPAKAVDAACASSLVSVHDAVADLQQRKADLALAGGVHAMLNGRVYELRADSMMLSPDGQCKAFDASADGYVRGEGCGVVVLKRQREAEADGDRIWAVIRGAAVNHGGASAGLTVPNTPALKTVIEAALDQAGISPKEVDYLEAHGTGTTVGDPIEMNAAAAVYGAGREMELPLLVGSVKTNIGHLEAAAGVAGLIKAAMVVKHGVIPRHLHFREPNPDIEWARLPLQVTTDRTEWPCSRAWPRRAGVNSFGISGTNAHIVVEEPRDPHGAPGKERPPVGFPQSVPVVLPSVGSDLQITNRGVVARAARVLPMSGKSDAALRELAQGYLSWLAERGEDLSSGSDDAHRILSDMAWTAGAGRGHFDFRAGVVFEDLEVLRERLRAVADADKSARSRGAASVAFAYTGQGSQWSGMGRELYEREPVARAVFDRCEDVFREQRGTSLLDVMFGRSGAAGQLDDTAWEQPALYALGCALTGLWASLGIRPDVVIGHSVGELAAAQAAGVFGLEDGMRFAEARGKLLSATETGAMAAVFAPEARVASAVEVMNAENADARLSVSADNGLHQVVSGTTAGIEALSRNFESTGVRVRRLNTTRAFHSALVEPALEALESSLERVEVKSPSLSVISNVTGMAVEPNAKLDGQYWRRHAREAVAFAAGVRSLADHGVDLVVEIGPRPILGPMAVSAWPESGGMPPRVLSSLWPPSQTPGPGSEADRGFADAVASAYEAGLPIRFEGLFAGETRRRISVPGYPFQRERHWLDAPRQRRRDDGLPLLGVRHESAVGEITYETELLPSEPAWLNDHKVFGHVVVPGALYGAMAASAFLAEDGGSVAVENMQLHNPLVFPERDSEDGPPGTGRIVQVLLGASESDGARAVRVFSKGSDDEWTLHVEGRVSAGATDMGAAQRIDIAALKAGMSTVDVEAYYRARAGTGIDLGPSFRTLGNIWSSPGEALAEVSVPEELGRNGLAVHPLILDGCFQVVGAARGLSGTQASTTYLPFGWERLWLARKLPERVFCHVTMRKAARDPEPEAGEPPEVQSGEVRIYDPDGSPIGVLSGYAVKRATPTALLAAIEGIDDLLYEVVWRERSLAPGLESADFLPSPAAVKARSGLFAEYLSDAGVRPEGREALLGDLEQWSRSYALANLDQLGWRRVAGETVDPESLRQQLKVDAAHRRLFRRMLEMLAKSGVLEEADDEFTVLVGSGDPWPDGLPQDPDRHAERMVARHEHGLTEIGLFRRSGNALADVLCGREDPLTLLFSSGEPTAADLYLRAPVARAANRMLGEAVRTLVAELPPGRTIRVVEIGAGTGSATASVLPELPCGRFEYMYTDISAGFFAEAEARFGDGGGSIQYSPLDIEKDPAGQGFDSHGYDLLIASNVLHATRYLEETLAHCRMLLAPSGQLIALENLRGQGWMDLTFGQLDGWWRFADAYRPHHALAGPAVWRRALADAGFEGIEVLGVDETDMVRMPDRGVIVASAPVEVKEAPHSWVLAADSGGVAARLAEQLATRNQTVILAGSGLAADWEHSETGPGIRRADVEVDRRESWRRLIESLPRDMPFGGVVHLTALDGRGAEATTRDIAADVRVAGASALALLQGVVDSDCTPEKGTWLLTRGAQILERERGGALAGATLWGLGKAVAREAAHLQPRMIDLDPEPTAPVPDLVNEMLYPDAENHVAYRSERRQVARLVRAGDGQERLSFPGEPNWVLSPDPGGAFDRPRVQPLSARRLDSKEVRVGVDAAGLNFWDVFRSLGFIEEGLLGREMCGRILEAGAEVSGVAAGDRVVGLGFGAFGPEMITRGELVAPAPAGFPVSGLATVPSAFVSAALSFELSGLEAGERVLIHAGAGGVGLAAIQLAQAAGAEVFATASQPKQSYLRSLGVSHIFDSRQTAFGKEILDATGGAGVDVVLNSLTSEGFIDASLSCLKKGGRFVELARRDILSEEEMVAVRPDVTYAILELDVLKKTDPAWVGRVLNNVVERLAAGELNPIVHSRWPLAEAGAALRFMRSARHLGKIVVTAPPLAGGELRRDRTYLVTGGLGGIGCAVGGWLADRGAGTIVLNGRREPDAEAGEAIRALRERGVAVHVELADVTDGAALDRMLARIDAELPPLAGVIHSVGVLSDGALTNQSWERFETVLWPKVLGAWHLHRATVDRDLDHFILFSSRVGVMGNPGQANHAAANAFLDQLAGHRRAMGLPGQAIAWGAWSEIGEAAEQKDRIERQRAALGGRWFSPQQGLKALDRLVRQDVTTSVVMSMDWSVFEEAVDDRPPFLEDLLSLDSESEASAPSSSADVLSRLREAPVAARGELLVSFLQGEVQAVLRLPTAPEPTVGFFDLGMDSLMAVELRNRLNRAFSGQYTASNTVVFDHPDIAALARHLSEALGEIEHAPVPEAPPDAERGPEAAHPPVVAPAEDSIAIVGMACRFPGAPDLQRFWNLLETGADVVADKRRQPALWNEFAKGLPSAFAAYGRGGFVDGIDEFDARFFRITPIEARRMDPRHRMLLETSWHALEDAGVDPVRLRGSRTGVYVGIATSEYRDLMISSDGGMSYLGTAPSTAVGRVAFQLGVEGPTMPVELNCASSLVAVHHAVSGLRLGEADLALVGGVHAILSPGIVREMAELGMLSPEGLCKAFDAAADGFVRGEGCGMIVLKRLREAEADGDLIWGLIRGSAVNQNGASAGPTVPNGLAQERLIETALAQAGVSPVDVEYLEAHGAGSDLGDSIELRAAAAVYGKGRNPDEPLLVGSVKTNIGHLEPAAGIASLIKTVLALRQGMIPQSLHFRDPNPNVDWEQLGIQVVSELTEWPARADGPSRAGISAFGISGANAHVVVEDYDGPVGTGPPPEGLLFPQGIEQTITIPALDGPAGLIAESGGAAGPRTTRVLPLSGKSRRALQELASQYLLWLEEQGQNDCSSGRSTDAVLSDMAWTAGIGRSHFAHRAAIVFEDTGSLRHGLGMVAEGKTGMDPDAGSDLDVSPRVAFLFSGEDNGILEMGAALYEREPVVRVVLDRCDTVLRDEGKGVCLLDAILGRERYDGDPSKAAWYRPAIYAMECALVELWRSIGIQPQAAVGLNLGEVAAARAAGMLSLDDGLRLAAVQMERPLGGDAEQVRIDLEPLVSGIAVTEPSHALISGFACGLMQSDEALKQGCWLHPAPGPEAIPACADTLADLEIRLLVGIGTGSPIGAAIAAAGTSSARREGSAGNREGSLTIISSLGQRSGTALSSDPGGALAEAVGAVYEAGLPVSFAGLFAGETRRRISIPGYPFQRRSHWVTPLE